MASSPDRYFFPSDDEDSLEDELYGNGGYIFISPHNFFDAYIHF